MTHSPIANKLANLLRSNPKLEEKEVKKCVPMVVTRIVGFIHNAVQVRPCAPCTLPHPRMLTAPGQRLQARTQPRA